MSMLLNMGTQPAGLEIRTQEEGSAGTTTIFLGDYKISLKDFLTATKFVLTNTDLKPNDPRLRFVRCVQSMQKIQGYNPGRKRLGLPQEEQREGPWWWAHLRKK